MKKKYALLPFLVFLLIFAGLHIFCPDHAHDIQENFPLFAVFVALIVSFFTFSKKESIQDRVEIFIEGSSNRIIIHMCYIFFFSTVFTYILDQIGAIDTIVKLSLDIMPSTYILPSLFIITSIFSLTIGSSMGAIAAFMPIAIQIAQSVGIPLPLIGGTILCGSIFGDNLSILSDTTISAVRITKCSMKDKLRLNTLIALPAFFITLGVLIYENSFFTKSIAPLAHHTLYSTDFFNLIPYLLVFGLALYGLDIVITLVFGIIAASTIGLLTSNFTFLETIGFLFKGFYSSREMVHVCLLVLFLAGLSHIVAHNGGLEYILKKTERVATNKFHVKIAMFVLVCLVNAAIVINTISIVITGSVASKLGKKYKINPAETATILDIGSCVSQGILPYTPQILLITSMAKISPLSLLPHLSYQYALIASMFGYFLYKKALQ